ncbi:BamA/TamA family outer membrane protein [Paucibacter sp. DJ2R-2]|nr:BamA/TamA family outer membrane protein [Paucibacter sp. DJ4R-1]MCV2441072.1 BamA/TamA family outer membrane protein [Paucibacter sp. DJ2R-2]
MPNKPLSHTLTACACLLALHHASATAQATTAAASTPPTAERPAASRASIQGFEVQGNTLLPRELIEQRLIDFKGEADLKRMRDAAAALQDLYRKGGYGGVIAFLPEQTLDQGVLRIRVVEGRLERIEVTAGQYFDRDNLLASLPTLQVGQTPQVRLIDAQIQMANENPAKNVQVLLQPGSEPGRIVAKVSIKEQTVQRWYARADNTGSERTGRWRAAAGWQHANLWGQDHVLNTELQTAPEHPSQVLVFSGNYRVPLYGRAMSIDAYGAWSNVDGGKSGTAAGDLEFSGKGHVLGLRVSKYLQRIGNVDQRLHIGLEHRDYLNSCRIEGLPAGACGSAGASIRLQPVTLNYTVQTEGVYRTGLSLGWSHNFGWGGNHASKADFEALRRSAKPRYDLFKVNANASLPLGSLGRLQVRLAGQHTTQPLVAGEAFGLGGAMSVRGFEERELVGDIGMQGSIEFWGNNLAEPLGLSQAALVPLLFADAGYVSNVDGAPCQPGQTTCRMGSIGAGLRVEWQGAQLRLDWAVPANSTTSTHRGNSRLHLGLSYNF